MDAREESEWYQRDYDRGLLDARLDPHGEILLPADIECLATTKLRRRTIPTRAQMSWHKIAAGIRMRVIACIRRRKTRRG